MKVLIVTNGAPFVFGGAEALAQHLARNLILEGHEAELLTVPFAWDPASRIPTQMLLARNLELTNVDRVIALKFPAYLVPHHDKVFWLVHQFRQAYDLLDSGHSPLGSDPESQVIVEAIRRADAEVFAAARRVFTIGRVPSERLLRYNGVESTVLLPPLNDPEFFVGGEPGDYIFAAGRINSMKRQHLLIEALAHADPAVRLVIGGPPDSPADTERLEQTIAALGVEDRVTLDVRFLPREVYADYVNHARAIAYVPVDEDALSYVAVEAAVARKPLVSATDSGGVLGVAIDGATGWVVDPTPEALGGALTEAWNRKKKRSVSFGDAAHELVMAMDLSWPKAVEALLA